MPDPTVSSRHDRREALREERRQRQRGRAAIRRRNRLLLALAGVVAVALVAVVSVILISGQSETANGDLAPMVAVADPYPGLPQQARLLGDPNAPLRLVEYGDYQCPVCRQVEETIVPALVQRYVATGLLSFEFRDYLVIDGNLARRDPGYDRESLRAAEGAMCAADQGQYWAFHTSLYRNHTGEGVGDFSDTRVRELAAALGLDTAAFGNCLDEGTYRSTVQRQSEEAGTAGITGTPTFMVGDQRITASSVEDSIAQIDAILVANGITPPVAAVTVAPVARGGPLDATVTRVAIRPGRGRSEPSIGDAGGVA